MSEWISVKDKLPISDWVIVYADGPMGCMWCNSDGEWTDPTGAIAHNIVISEITHWMPFPEPPEGFE